MFCFFFFFQNYKNLYPISGLSKIKFVSIEVFPLKLKLWY